MGLFSFFKKKKVIKSNETQVNEVVEKEDKLTVTKENNQPEMNNDKDLAYCPKCGSELLDGFCPKCGELVSSKKDINNEFEEKDKEKNEYVIERDDDINGVNIKSSIKVTISENNPFNEPYNEALAYSLFFEKYKNIESPKDRDPLNYVYFMFTRAGVNSIKEVRKLHEELFEKGYYKKGDKSDLYLNDLKVGDLREIANNFSIDAKGKKADIIKTLSEKLSYDQLREYFGYDIYTLSEKVDGFKDEHELENEFYNDLTDDNLTLKDFIELRKIKSLDDINLDFNQKRAKEKSDTYCGSHNYAWIGNYFESHNQPDIAVKNYLLELLVEVSGMIVNSHDWEEYKRLDMPARDWCNDPILIDRDTVDRIHNLGTYITDSMINEVLLEKLKFNACPDELFKNIIQAIIGGSFNDTLRKKTENALNQNLKIIRKEMYGK